MLNLDDLPITTIVRINPPTAASIMTISGTAFSLSSVDVAAMQE